MNNIYLDYAATTPVDARVMRAMEPYFSRAFGNPGSVHFFGQEAIAAVDASREAIAEALGADFREIIFTGSATEANNLALRGVVKRIKNQKSRVKNLRIIISAIEHESVRETARDLEREGVEVVEIPVDRRGILDLKKLESALNERTVLVSVMYANNEIGTVQPVAEISRIFKNFRGESRGPSHESPFPLFHTDAVQAFQFLDCDVSRLGVDLMTLSAHKIYGPKGVGALYMRDKQQATSDKSLFYVAHSMSPIITGGGQEFGLRSGTENVPLIAGFSEAVRLASAARALEAERIQKLRDYFWNGLKKIFPASELNATEEEDGSKTHAGRDPLFLPNILSVHFPSRGAEDMVTRFDLAGLAVSSGSACKSRAFRPSSVLESIGLGTNRAKESVRFSLGRPTTTSEIDTALKRIKMIS